MKKIPTLFERVFENHRIVDILPNVTPGMEWVLAGEGDATLKVDGACCAIIDGHLYKRYDCKKGKVPPIGAIACCDPDPITGHWPHWVRIDGISTNPSDYRFLEAYHMSFGLLKLAGLYQDNHTYEAVGPKFRGNPYKLPMNYLLPHGLVLDDVPRDFEGIKEYLRTHYIEGIVFWKDGEPKCKIKRSDFGFDWN